jgi:hypothetical protein
MQTEVTQSGTPRTRLSKRFATGKELRYPKLDLESLRHNLQWAEALKDESRIESHRKAIKNGENRDIDLMYAKSLRLINQAMQVVISISKQRATWFLIFPTSSSLEMVSRSNLNVISGERRVNSTTHL